MTNIDLVVFGAGPAGYRAAEYAAKQGLKVLVFEEDEVGGTCLNVGCIPTKTYVHAATFEEARSRMAQVVPQLRQGVEAILSHPNITLMRGHMAITSAHKDDTDVDPGVVSDQTVNPDFSVPHMIIATGSETKWLPIEGARTNPRVVDSTGLLQLERLPRRLVIIGAGVIGMEFASVFSRFGSEVTVIEYLKECLPALDSDIAKRLRKQMERHITFHMQCAVKQIVDGKVVFETKKGQTQSVEADVILMATGRKPRTEDLGLEAFGITLGPNGAIPVNDNFQTTVKDIYAIGDCNGRQMLAHAAEMQAVRAVNHILGKKDGIRFDVMPAAIFTEPEAACVGPTEDQLKAAGRPYVCKKAFWRANGKALAMGETEGMLKLFVSPPEPGGDSGGLNDGLILGCHAYGAHAADIVQEVSVLMCKSTTLGELADMVHIHPTLSEILRSAAEN